jgi:hypothetical protein
LATVRVVLRTNVLASDSGVVLQSVDELYRMNLWVASLRSVESPSQGQQAGNARAILVDRSIFRAGSRGQTWRAVEGLYIPRAESGSIEIILRTILDSPATYFALWLLARWLDRIADPRVRAAAELTRSEAELKRSEAKLKDAEAARTIEGTRGLRIDGDHHEVMYEFDELERSRELTAPRGQLLSDAQVRNTSRKPALDQVSILGEAHETTRIADELIPKLFEEPIRKGLPVGDAARLLRAASVRAARLEKLQQVRHPIERVQIEDETSRSEQTKR